MASFEIIVGDCLESLRGLPSESVNCCVTSPPYWALRDYGIAGQVGLEDSAAAYVNKMVEVFGQVRRILRNDGTLWLNLGDSYAGGGNYRGINSENTLTSKQSSNRGARGVSQALGALGKDAGCKDKEMVGIPWLTAFALRADGWYLRQDIIWAKPNPMPESVHDRCTKSHEYIFLMSKNPKYFFDAEAIKEPAVNAGKGKSWEERKADGEVMRHGLESAAFHKSGGYKTGDKRNKRDVWFVTPAQFREAHFATYPPKLIEPCILAGCPLDGTVLDPFCGSGTTGVVALQQGKNFIGLELNPEYAEMARRRIAGACTETVQPTPVTTEPDWLESI